MKVVFFGTPSFAAGILEQLLQDPAIDVVAVVSKPDRAQGRSARLVPTEVKAYLLEAAPKTPLFQPEKVSVKEMYTVLEAFQADVFVVAAYGEIISQTLLDMPRYGCINVHTSLLPRYRGAAPIQRALLNGDPESGVTIMYMDRKMDTGDIIQQVPVPIPQEMNAGELEYQLLQAGATALIEVLSAINEGTVVRSAQEHDQATLAPKITSEELFLDWKRSSQELHNQVRALSPKPTAWTFVTVRGQRKRVKIFRTEVMADHKGKAGTVLELSRERFLVACGEGALAILELQLEGKKRLPYREFAQGFSAEDFSFETA